MDSQTINSTAVKRLLAVTGVLLLCIGLVSFGSHPQAGNKMKTKQHLVNGGDVDPSWEACADRLEGAMARVVRIAHRQNRLAASRTIRGRSDGFKLDVAVLMDRGVFTPDSVISFVNENGYVETSKLTQANADKVQRARNIDLMGVFSRQSEKFVDDDSLMFVYPDKTVVTADVPSCKFNGVYLSHESQFHPVALDQLEDAEEQEQDRDLSGDFIDITKKPTCKGNYLPCKKNKKCCLKKCQDKWCVPKKIIGSDLNIKVPKCKTTGQKCKRNGKCCTKACVQKVCLG